MISISPARSWPLAQAACSGVRLPGPSSATEGSALARKSSAITSSEPWPAASQSAPAHAEAVAKELAMSRRIRAGWPQEAALRNATATSFSSCRASGTTRAASNSRASSSPNGASPPGFGTSALRAKLCRSSPRPSLVSRPRIVTCSGNTSCQNACSRNRNRPGPRGAPLDKSLTSRGWAAGAATASRIGRCCRRPTQTGHRSLSSCPGFPACTPPAPRPRKPPARWPRHPSRPGGRRARKWPPRSS
mmetsp:Transcript_100420/g.269685  ORF Transcript_100420/g.269685 Transcript_100420/m.269685 type:complete len:247 (-) Transcript_100420:925-1665(-)